MALSVVELTPGREVRLMQLMLESTYGGFLEGYPNPLVNDRIVRGLADRAGRLFPHTPVWVIKPPRTIVDDGVDRPFGPREDLPPVICIGSFVSGPVHAEAGLHISSLVVVWLQEDTSVPEGWEAPVELLDVPWDEQARDGEL